VYDPSGDANAFYQVLTDDTELMTLLGWTSGGKMPYVWKGMKYPDDIVDSNGAAKTRRICFYFAPSRAAPNPLTSIEVVQFVAFVPIEKPDVAYQIQARIKTLLHMKTVNGRYLEWGGQQGQIPAPKGFFGLGVRYRYSIVI